MAVKITLGNPSRVTKEQVVLNDSKLKFPRILYQRLGSLVKNRTLLDDYNNGRLPLEYVELLEQLNVYHAEKYYNSENNTPEYIKELDVYLGSLGITEEYHYSKDTNNGELWLTVTSQSEYRILMDELEPNPEVYLVDGDEPIIFYT